MKNSKYIKVSVSDRMPEVDKKVIVIYNSGETGTAILTESGYWFSIEFESECDQPDFWLQEVPDYEEEMKEFIQYVSDTMPSGSSLQEKAKTLLTKLKTEP